jgi:glyoxylase-like metal-dependent hydrolase (beta-lactamase superfamily II)
MKTNRWHLATAGQLSRNKFWGEDETVFYHPVLATSTVVQTKNGNLLIDPSLDAPMMGDAVFNCCGIKPEDIHIIYSTHIHLDHWKGLEAFKTAKVFMAEEDARTLQGLREYMDEKTQEAAARIRPSGDELLPGVSLVPLPGHTRGVRGVLFEAPEGKILAAGDAVMNAEFFAAKEGYFYSVDADKSKESIMKAAASADFIIPGHGNYFMVKAYPFREKDENETKPIPQNPESQAVNRKITIGEVIRDEERKALFLNYLPNLTPLQMMMAKEIPLSAIMASRGFKEPQMKELFDKLQLN